MRQNLEPGMQMIDKAATSKEIDSNPKYDRFVAWMREFGARFDDVQFPTVFENGLTGISAKREIGLNQAFLTVPNILIVSVDKALKDEQLKDFYESNLGVFGPKHPDHEFLILASYLLHNYLLGESSFWHPYLQVMNEADLPSRWPDADLHLFQDAELVKSAELYRSELESEWQVMEPLFQKRPDLFPPASLSKPTFLKMYNFVCTRCFGWGLPCVMMVPLVDYLNHMPVDTEIGLFNLQHQKKKDENKVNFGLLFD